MDSRLGCKVEFLELTGCQIVEGRMNPSAVIESLDIVKDTLPGLRSAVIAAVEDKLPFQYAEEALNRSIVPAVAGAAHAAWPTAPDSLRWRTAPHGQSDATRHGAGYVS